MHFTFSTFNYVGKLSYIINSGSKYEILSKNKPHTDQHIMKVNIIIHKNVPFHYQKNSEIVLLLDFKKKLQF